jgi:hypothetical protein
MQSNPSDEPLNRLIRLRLLFERLEQDLQEQNQCPCEGTLAKVGLSGKEVEAWLENEPDFTKRIVTPIKSSKPNEDETLPYVR